MNTDRATMDQYYGDMWKIAKDTVKPLIDNWESQCETNKILDLAKEYLSTTTEPFDTPTKQHNCVIGHICYVLTKEIRSEIENKIDAYQHKVYVGKYDPSTAFLSPRTFASKVIDPIRDNIRLKISPIVDNLLRGYNQQKRTDSGCSIQ